MPGGFFAERRSKDKNREQANYILIALNHLHSVDGATVLASMLSATHTGKGSRAHLGTTDLVIRVP